MMSEHELSFSGGPVSERIVRFIRRHHVMTLATISASDTLSAGDVEHIAEPWCANVFYSYMAGENLFVFTTGDNTRHGSELSTGGIVAASIVLETKNIGLIQGLQLQGYAQRADLPEQSLLITNQASLKDASSLTAARCKPQAGAEKAEGVEGTEGGNYGLQTDIAANQRVSSTKLITNTHNHVSALDEPPRGMGHEFLKKARSSYLKRFPYAVATDLTLWVLAPVFMKLTDNRLGFGKKLHWQRDSY